MPKRFIRSVANGYRPIPTAEHEALYNRAIELAEVMTGHPAGRIRAATFDEDEGLASERQQILDAMEWAWLRGTDRPS